LDCGEKIHEREEIEILLEQKRCEDAGKVGMNELLKESVNE